MSGYNRLQMREFQPNTIDRRRPLGRTTFLVVALLVMTPCMIPARGSDSPRLRTLTFDPQQHDWTETPPPPPGTSEGDAFAIRQLIKEKKNGPALGRIKKFIKKYGQGDAQYPDVLTAKAAALVGQEEYYQAHEVLTEFLAQFSGMALTSEAIRLEIVVAEAFLHGAKRKWLGMAILDGEEVGLRILDQISADFPDTEYAEYALKTKGDFLFRNGDHSLAELEYSRMARDYPRSRYQQFAVRRSADAALASFRGIDYDDAPLIEAADRFGDYRTRYPQFADREGVGLILDDIREKRGEKELVIGQYYERTNHLGSAVFQYEVVLRFWPKTQAATKAAERLALLGVGQPVAAAE